MYSKNAQSSVAPPSLIVQDHPSNLDTSPVIRPSRGLVTIPLGKLRDLEAIRLGQLSNRRSRRNQLETRALARDIRHDGHGSLSGLVVGAVGGLHGGSEFVAGHVDADGDVGAQGLTRLRHVRVPLVELGDGEVAEFLGDGGAGVAGGHCVEGRAVCRVVDADLRERKDVSVLFLF